MNLKERDLQNTVVSHLHSIGYEIGQNKDFDRELCFYKEDLIRFLTNTQGDLLDSYKEALGGNWEKELLLSIDRDIKRRGIVEVLRKGVKLLRVDGSFDLLYPMPNTTLNPMDIKNYNENIFKVTEEFIPEVTGRERIDVVVSINGIPLIFMELKYSGTQTYHNAISQWKTDRDSKRKIYSERGLVFFALDENEVHMATKLAGEKTFFLPFNKGNNKGKGNPLAKDNFKTHYLWDEILTKEVITDIIKRYYYIEKKTNPKTKKAKETPIFPRYHQLDSVRRVLNDVKENGCGSNYLIQHSAGSGKTNSITWLAHRLANIHDYDNENVFNSVIIVTDRRVLDKQLQDAVSQLDKHGIVEAIDDKKKSSDLARAIENGKKVIITTIQKFPHALNAIEDLKSGRYGVIIDEAHSSTAGETMGALKMTLNGGEVDEDLTSDEVMAEFLERRAVKGNISFFAFTATPKDKTMQIFGRKGTDDKPHEFHLYSMKQAIQEKFIIDVLKNYTTYDMYYKIAKKVEDNPEFDKGKAKRAVTRYMSLNEYNIREKSMVMVDDFMENRNHWIEGKAKGMVVTGSRLSAVKYKKIIDKYLVEKGYTIKTLVAFSGTINYEDEEYTEEKLNGIKNIPEEFEKDEYKLLIVADKYQTGFDQPKLCAMYVDKSLGGVKCVQTLSRLNRRYNGKQTFVLDFVNEIEDVQGAFKPYYEDTNVSEVIDPEKLADKYWELRTYSIYNEEWIRDYSILHFLPKRTGSQDAKLNSIVDEAIETYMTYDDEMKEKFRGGAREYINLYKFLLNITTLPNVEFLKLYLFIVGVYKRLPKDPNYSLDLDAILALDYYKLKKTSEGDISIPQGEGELVGIGGGSSKKKEEELEGLDLILNRINEVYGVNLSEGDKIMFENVSESFSADPKIKQIAMANTKEDFIDVFGKNHFKKGLIRQKKTFATLVTEIMKNETLSTYLMNTIAEKLYSEMR